MNTRLDFFREQLRAKYWFVPSILLALAILLSVVLVRIDEQVGFELIASIRWLYLGGPDGARTVLSTIASSTITVAGVVFSIVIVALSNASTQFGPRLLTNFLRDRSNQFVLGIFLATFIYCLLILRTIRTGDTDASSFVPYISVSVGIFMALASILSFVYFVHHVSLSISANRVIDLVGDELDRAIDRLYPSEAPRALGDIELRLRDESDLPPDFEERSSAFCSDDNGYVQAIDYGALTKIASENDAILRVNCRPGLFVKKDGEMGKFFPGDRLDVETHDRIRSQFIIGPERVGQQDIEFAIDQLVEVATRSLSASINDPYTVMICIDRLGSALATLAERRIPSGYFYDEDGRLRVITHPVTFSGLLDDAFNLIRQHSRGDVAITIRLLEALAVVAKQTNSPGNAAHVWRHAAMVYRAAMESIPEPNDREDVEVRFGIVRQILGIEEPEMETVSAGGQ